MANDQQLLMGKWTVWVKNWVWEYEFLSDGAVSWRDTQSLEKGTGRWSLSPKLVNISWFDSGTKESWQRPLSEKSSSTWYNSAYFVGSYRIEKKAEASPVADNRDLTKYVDNFVWCKYDVNYKVPADLSFEFSFFLQLRFPDGITMDFDYRQLEDRGLDDRAWRDAMDWAYVGPSGRLYPRVMAKATTPRLWSNRLAAIEMRDEASLDFFLTAQAGVAAVLSVPAIPVGPMTQPDIRIRTTKLKTPGLTRPTTPTPIASTTRPRATPTQLRAMLADPENTFVWATPGAKPGDIDKVQNQTVTFTGETNPGAVDKVHLFKGRHGITGHKYGQYKVAIDGRKHLIRASQHNPGEYFVDEIPANQGLWFNDEDLAGIGIR